MSVVAAVHGELPPRRYTDGCPIRITWWSSHEGIALVFMTRNAALPRTRIKVEDSAFASPT